MKKQSKPPLRLREASLSSSPFPDDKLEATPDEIFVADGWHKSWVNSPWAGTVRRHRAFGETLATIRDLAERGMKIFILEGTTVETFVGFVAYEVRHDGRYILHYLYVKDALRRRGFSKDLMTLIDTDRYFYTHRTRFTKYLPKGQHRREYATRRRL